MSAFIDCLNLEASAISKAAEKIDQKEVDLALKLLQKCYQENSKLILLGVGKSGIVARKISATFTSIGLTSFFLNPLDALHGDIGIVNPSDVCLMISNSGDTQELLNIFPHLQRRGNKVIGIFGNPKSFLARKCDIFLEAGIEKEICPLNLAPTASTAVAMAIGDALASVWMEEQKISPVDFAYNHPAGSLGKKLTLTASDLMISISNLKPINTHNSFSELISIITQNGIGCGWVEDSNNNFVGLITDGDLRRALEESNIEKWKILKAGSLMTKDPITVFEYELVVESLKIMENNPKKSISVLPVISKDNKLLGLLRLHDLIKAGFK